ncbi:hypothetical protein CEXT_428331 [Caerostris extrusa]|uniref:Uncharacterized protein n=1 Tax=Caerostris extrusa TaxID=172846 RepID=A0AAV4X7N5_CAEEX|nr:hypothetical protein CEXT_428331 [Caerostris extrusa]
MVTAIHALIAETVAVDGELDFRRILLAGLSLSTIVKLLLWMGGGLRRILLAGFSVHHCGPRSFLKWPIMDSKIIQKSF